MIIDIHTHFFDAWSRPAKVRRLLDLADRFEIHLLCAFLGPRFYRHPTVRQMREANDFHLALMKRRPGRITGFCYLNPRLGKVCRTELDRCIGAGMRGIKLWTSCAANHQAVFPIVEHAIRLNVPILQHTWQITGGQDEDHTNPRQFVELAERYPEARFIMAHAGGNWVYGVKAVRHLKNVWIDTSGGPPINGYVEFALRHLGPGRIVYGSDAPIRSFGSALSKIDSAPLSTRDRQVILFENARQLLGLEK